MNTAAAARLRGLVVLPTYNERDNLPELVEAVLAVDPGLSVLIVDDNSPDGTGDLADALKERHSRRVSVLHRESKQGLGTAYLAGFREALTREVDLVFEMDADFSHAPHHLTALIEAARDADLVIGSRYVPGGGIRDWGGGRRLLSAGGNVYARWILGLPIRDLTSGFKCYRRSVVEILEKSGIRSNGYAFQIETTYRCHLAGFRIREVPIVFEDRRVGQSKMSSAIFREAVRLVPALRLRKSRLSEECRELRRRLEGGERGVCSPG